MTEYRRIKDASISVIARLNQYELKQNIYDDIEVLARMMYELGREAKSLEIGRNKRML